jgi:hypothetical protein
MGWILTGPKAETFSQTRVMPGSEHQFELVYDVQWVPDGTNPTFPADGNDQLFAVSGLPKVRDRVPAAFRSSSLYMRAYVCRQVQAFPRPEGLYQWEVRCTFGTLQVTVADEQAQYVAVTRQSGVRQAQVWRLAPTFPTNGSVTWPTGVVDVAGTKVDLNGNPPAYEVPQMTITVEVLWDRTAGSPVNAEPPTSTWSTYVGKRNDAAFLGCAIGSLVYRGFSVSPHHEWYRIQHTFLWDEWFHLEQVPGPIPTGAPACTTGVTVAGLVVLQADKVVWFQKYQTLANYNNIVSALELAELTAPKPTAV